jgi:hypothetical protein
MPTPNGSCARSKRSASIGLIPIGERHFRRAISEYVARYHRERNHQGIANELIAGAPATSTVGPIRRRPRLGGLLNYYDRAA